MIHARMRMLCSPFNDHLYSHIHVVDSPACACGHPRENNKHFFLQCPLFDNERQILMDGLNHIDFLVNLKNLLFGSENYSEEVNGIAFELIQVFIKNTGRF